MRAVGLAAFIAIYCTSALAQSSLCLKPSEPYCLSNPHADAEACKRDVDGYRDAIRFYHSCLEEEAYQERQRARRDKEAAEEALRKAQQEAEKAKREAEYLRAQAERAATEAKYRACRAAGHSYC